MRSSPDADRVFDRHSAASLRNQICLGEKHFAFPEVTSQYYVAFPVVSQFEISAFSGARVVDCLSPSVVSPSKIDLG